MSAGLADDGRTWEERALAAEAELARLQPVVAAAKLVQGLRRPPVARAARFRVYERFHDTGAVGLMLECQNAEAEALVRAVEPRETHLEVRRFAGEVWPGGELAPALEILDAALGKYRAGRST